MSDLMFAIYLDYPVLYEMLIWVGSWFPSASTALAIWGTGAAVGGAYVNKRQRHTFSSVALIAAWPLVTSWVIGKTFISAAYGWVKEDILGIAPPAENPHLIDK